MSAPVLISPSILSADCARLGEEVRALEEAGADWIHFDVMDNHYVPNLTFGAMVCRALRPHTALPLDVHLMVTPVDAMASAFADAGASIISFHPEASPHPQRTAQLIRQHKCKVGLVFNPATPLQWLDYLLDDIDLVLLMSVNPGFGGQTFIPSIMAKISDAKKRLDNYNQLTQRQIYLQVDGGVNANNSKEIVAAGANVLVAGSAIFREKNYRTAIKALR